jgi:hypothetical protein
MTIRHDEEWIAIAQLDEQNQIYFTREFQALIGDLGWEVKAFVGHLLGMWYDPFEHMLAFIGKPKQPTFTVCQLAGDEYVRHQYRLGQQIHSPLFLNLDLRLDDILPR